MGKGMGNRERHLGLLLDPPATAAAPVADTDEQALEQALSQASSYPERVLLAHRLCRLRHPEAQLPAPKLEPQRLDEAFEQDLKALPGHPRAVFLEGSVLEDGICYVEWSKARSQTTRYWQQVLAPPHHGPEHEEFDALAYDLKRLERLARQRGLAHQTDELLELQTAWASAFEKLRLAGDRILLRGSRLTYEDWLAHLQEQYPVLFAYGFDDPERRSGPAARLFELLHPAGAPQADNAWAFSGPERFCAFAHVPDGAAEWQLLVQLQTSGARLEENPIELPSYDSSHHIEGGVRYTLELGDGVALHYIPHRVATGRADEVRTYHAQLTPTPAQMDELRRRLAEDREHLAFHPEEHLFVIQYTDERGNPLPEQRPLLVTEETFPLFFSRPKVREALDSGKVVKYHGEHMVVRRAGAADVERLGQDGYVRLEDGRYMSRTLHERLRRRQAALQWLETACPTNLAITWQGIDDKKATLDQLEFKLRHASSIPEDVKLFPLDHFIEGRIGDHPYPTVRTETHVQPVAVPQTAPASERGKLVIEGAKPQEVVEHLKQLGLCEGACRHVPYDLIYGQERWRGARFGLVAPKLDEYATGARRPVLPFDHLVLHGMTGVKHPGQALRRLEAIAEHGGLKSIAERRRSGISVTSMSPKGDIASGIDMGVPCTITQAPVYGSFIFFAMKPSVLERRDVIFAPHDFGGGEDRYEKFAAYARQINHTKPYDPPSHACRQEHYTWGLGADNEAYFSGEIRLSEIDTIFVSEEGGLYEQVKEKVAEWKRTGLVPSALKVRPFSGRDEERDRQLPSQIRRRARELAEQGAIEYADLTADYLDW